ncbi:MAG: mannosyltransferase [Glaciihabitans sp.]|nr:mannosyltransferase [Glaciihabitans sp.]
MTTTLRVIVDDILAPSSGGDAGYTEELTRYLIQTAPAGCDVSGIVSASPNSDYNLILAKLPGLVNLSKSALSRRELHKAWQHGLRVPGGGMIHATSLLAPLRRHDRLNNAGDQTVVTVQNTLAWTNPEALDSRDVAWQKTMAKRAHKYAQAVVVPNHTVAEQLDEVMRFGERIRVISGSVAASLVLPADVDARAEALGLPERYLLTQSSPAAHTGLSFLLRSMANGLDSGLPLLVIGPADATTRDKLGKLVAEAGIDPARVTMLGELGDEDRAVALKRATVVVQPDLAVGFGLSALEAFFFGTPVVHSDAASLVEVSAEAGVVVSRGEASGYPLRLAEAITSVVEDATLARRLSYAGLDRAGAFSWRDAAQRVWQLHADL